MGDRLPQLQGGVIQVVANDLQLHLSRHRWRRFPLPERREKGAHKSAMGRQDDFSMRVFVSDVMNQPTPFGLHVLLRRMVRRLFNSGGALTAAAVITLALIIGFQLGGAPWRFRRQVWQLQGALMGTVLGFIVGRFSANLPNKRDNDEADL